MIARSLLAAAFFAVLAAASPLFADQLALLREVRATGGGGEPRVELIVDRPVPFVTYTMPELRRAVIDLPGVEPAEVKNPIPVGSGMIDKVTIQKKRVNDVPLTRVIIHLQRDAEVSIAADAADGRKIVALLRAARQAPVTAPPTAKAPQPLPPAPLPTPARVAAPPAPPSRQNGQPAAIGKIVVTATGLEVNADAPLADFRAFILKEPHRLVVDIPRAKGSAGTVTLPANPWGIVTARTGVYPDKVRLVFDTSKAPVPPYTVAQTATGLKITFDAPARGQDKPAPKARRASRD